MTTAVATGSPASPASPHAVPIVILGTDALLAALPATPVQLAHACLRAGFANVIPASWGDELIATAVLQRLPQFSGGPVIQCSCPIVAHRLLAAGGDLRPAILGLVPPPVAAARYVRVLSGATATRITYVGACPGAIDDSIDIRMQPDALFALLAERDIVVELQPRVFESVLPPDRRRFRSQPGGVPTTDSLWSEAGGRTLVEIEGADFAPEVAQHLLSGKNVLIDAAPHLGCVCAGAIGGRTSPAVRDSVAALEPPRAMTPVVDDEGLVDIDMPLPAVSRTPLDVAAVLGQAQLNRPAIVPSPSALPLIAMRPSPVRGTQTVLDTSHLLHARPQPRTNGATPARSVLGTTPVARAPEGKALPRAYIARRRMSPFASMPPIPASPLGPESPPINGNGTTASAHSVYTPDLTQSSLVAGQAPSKPKTVEVRPGMMLVVDPGADESSELPATESAQAEPVASAPALQAPRAEPARENGDLLQPRPTPARPRPSVPTIAPAKPRSFFTRRQVLWFVLIALVLSLVASVAASFVVAHSENEPPTPTMNSDNL